MSQLIKKKMNNKSGGWVFAIHPFTHSPNDGFTLIELVIAMTIILIVSLGFFSWSSLIVGTNVSIERNNTAYAMAIDVADRLQRMYDNALIQPRSGNSKYVGYDDNTDKDTDGKTLELNGCSSGNPTVDLDPDSTPGMTIYTNPWGSSKLFLYDNNACENKTWVDSGCGSGIASITTGASGANANIDHPNAVGADTADNYDEINPIRFYKNTTYYAVWSVAYIPCNASANTDRRKIFITIYWMDPEPTENNVSAVQTGISGGTYTIKSVSLVIDKTIGAEVYTGS